MSISNLSVDESLGRGHVTRPPPGPNTDSIRRRERHASYAKRVVFSLGLFSVLVLAGIFGLLTYNAFHAFTGGIDLDPLSPSERAELAAETVAALDQRQAHPPSAWSDFIGEVSWDPGQQHYGLLTLIVSTLITTLTAMMLAAPLGVACALWLAFVARGRMRQVVKFLVEMIAAVPSVVVGFVGIVVTGPWIGDLVGVPGGLTALNGAVLLAIMALPTIISISEDALSAVPRRWLDASLALAADRWQTMWNVALPAARSGLFAASMLGMGRAIGETMTVLMATGNTAAMPHSLLDPVRTMTATIAIELGEVAQGTTHYYALFAVGLVLFLITLGVNWAADVVQRREEARLS